MGALWCAREIGEQTFIRYWMGDAETVAWIDKDCDDLISLFTREEWKRGL